MKVILSPEASRQLENLFAYLESEWSPASRRKFQKRFYQYVEVIKQMPKAFPTSPKLKNARKCVVTKQTSIYYRIKSDIIEILTVRDNRMDW
jgi:plasmid stabilization system protein ParE